MPDSKLSELTEATFVSGDDVLYIVNGDGSRKVQVENLLGRASAVLATPAASGSTSITLPSIPPGVVSGSVILIDAFTTEAELRSVSSVSGNTITVPALKYAHASGAAVVAVRDTIPISMFGLTGDGTDEWGPMQRLLLEAVPLSLKVLGSNREIYVAAPLCLQTGSVLDRLRLQSHTSFTPISADNAMINIGVSNVPFVATASNDTFTTTSAHGMGVNTAIIFFAPYGETIPTSVTPGIVYYVKTVPTGTTFTISDTLGGTTVDITDDGAGYFCRQVNSALNRVYWESVYLTLTVADLNGAILDLQQPSYTRNLRIEMDSPATSEGSAIGLRLFGQLSYHENMEINTSTNCHGLYLYGSGHIVRGFNCNGVANNDTAIVMGGQFHEISNVWAETLGRACIEMTSGAGNNRGNVISGACYCTTNPGASKPVFLNDGNPFAMLGTMRHTGTGQMIYSDTASGVQLFGWDGNTPGTGESDTYLVYHGHEGSPPMPRARFPKRIDDANYTIARRDNPVLVNALTADRTAILPTAANWRGWTVTLGNFEGGNNVIVACTGTETVDGASTLTLRPGEAVTVTSMESNYRIVSRYVSATLQTYAASNVTTDRTYDANATTIDEVADVLGTLIADLRARGIIA